jgi:Protein of unknown function (DUF3311)
VRRTMVALLLEAPVVKKPSLAAMLVALIPFAAMCFSVSLWDRVEPMVFGLPFNMFWLVSWIVISSFCLWVVYRIETARSQAGGP